MFDSAKDGLSASLTLLVPQGENCELHLLTLKNDSDASKRLSLYGAVEWCLWNAVDDSTNFQRNLNIGEVEVEDGVIYHKTEYRERRDHYAYYAANCAVSGFDTQREVFLGRFGSWQSPALVQAQTSSGSVAHGWSPIAALRIDAELAPGESRSFVFTLGYGQNPRDAKFIAPGVIAKTDAHRVLTEYSSPASVQRALNGLALYWDELLSRYHVTSADPVMDRMVNIWNQYQCMVTFNMSRSASYFESGTGRGMGFRDSCQDLLGFMHLIPERARERIIDIASIQFEDGSTYHQYQPLTKRGNGDVGSGFNDDPLWLVACTSAYIKETGDAGILQAPVPFNNVEGSEQPLFEHLRRSVGYTISHLGPHKLPLIGRADWNDCLNLNCFSNEPGESFQTCSNFESGIAESVFIAGMFVKYAAEYSELCRRYGDVAEAADIDKAVAAMREAVLQHGWDGEWFLRAYDAFGKKVGGNECPEGKIFIEPQGFCVMAGIGVKGGQAKTALDSVDKLLLGEYGVELLAPCYTVYHEELGEITSYPPGYKENGSIFCHNNPWISIAHAVLGDGDRAFDIYRRICPAYIDEAGKSDIRRSEPYAYAQTVAGRASFSEGESKNSWLTGAAAWTFVNISQAILGVQPQHDGLSVIPCLPSSLDGCKLQRTYRGVRYEINVKRTGSYSLAVDGVSVSGSVIPFDGSKPVQRVEVTV